VINNGVLALLGYDECFGSCLPTFRDSPIGPIFKCQALQEEVYCLTFQEEIDGLAIEDGTDCLSRNVGK
jgi:hypothetical protein